MLCATFWFAQTSKASFHKKGSSPTRVTRHSSSFYLLRHPVKRGSVLQCHDDADTAIVRAALDEAKYSSVEVRTEDTNIMVLLIYHPADHPKLLTKRQRNIWWYRKDLGGPPRDILEVFDLLAQLHQLWYSVSYFWVQQIHLANNLYKTDQAERVISVFLDIWDKDDYKAGWELCYKLVFHGKPPKDLALWI